MPPPGPRDEARPPPMLLLPLLACTAPDDASPADGDDSGVIVPTEWSYQDDDTASEMDVAALQAELQDLVDNLRGYTANPVLDSWAAVRAYGDEACPSETVVETPENGVETYFERLCIANDRTHFKGPMTTYQFTANTLLDFEVEDVQRNVIRDGSEWTGMLMKGQTDVYEVTSDLDFNCSCTAATASAEDPVTGRRQWWTYTDGTTHWSGPEDDGTWMEDGHQANVYLHMLEDPTDGYYWSHAAGSVTGRGETYGSVEIELSLSGRLGEGEVCAPSSTASFVARHTDTGRSVALDFTIDGGDDCTGCVTPEGASTEVCIDFSPINAWEGQPW